MELILASASPRRRELLARIVDRFLVIPSTCEEPEGGDPRDRVLRGACTKAREVAERHAGVILGADTLVVLEEQVLGKPCSRDEARWMLDRLSGREHAVLTGLCVVSTWTGEEVHAVEETFVRFRELADDEIARYVESGEADDKAGAYGVQGRAAVFVEGIRGDFYNVVGLPLVRTRETLRALLRADRPAGGEER